MAQTVNVFGTPVDFPDTATPQQIESYLNTPDFYNSLGQANPAAYGQLQKEQESQFRAREQAGPMFGMAVPRSMSQAQVQGIATPQAREAYGMDPSRPGLVERGAQSLATGMEQGIRATAATGMAAANAPFVAYNALAGKPDIYDTPLAPMMQELADQPSVAAGNAAGSELYQPVKPLPPARGPLERAADMVGSLAGQAVLPGGLAAFYAGSIDPVGRADAVNEATAQGESVSGATAREVGKSMVAAAALKTFGLLTTPRAALFAPVISSAERFLTNALESDPQKEKPVLDLASAPGEIVVGAVLSLLHGKPGAAESKIGDRLAEYVQSPLQAYQVLRKFGIPDGEIESLDPELQQTGQWLRGEGAPPVENTSRKGRFDDEVTPEESAAQLSQDTSMSWMKRTMADAVNDKVEGGKPQPTTLLDRTITPEYRVNNPDGQGGPEYGPEGMGPEMPEEPTPGTEKPGPEPKKPGPGTGDRGPVTPESPGLGTGDQGPMTESPGLGTGDHGPVTESPGLGTGDQGPVTPRQQVTVDEVKAVTAIKIKELQGDTSSGAIEEHDFLVANRDNPQAIADAYGVELVRTGQQDGQQEEQGGQGGQQERSGALSIVNSPLSIASQEGGDSEWRKRNQAAAGKNAEVETRPGAEPPGATGSAPASSGSVTAAEPPQALKGIKAHGLVSYVTIYGHTGYVKQADLDNDNKKIIRRYKLNGEPIAQEDKKYIHRDNIIDQNDAELMQLVKDHKRLSQLEAKDKQGKLTPEELAEGKALMASTTDRMSARFPIEGEGAPVVAATAAPEDARQEIQGAGSIVAPVLSDAPPLPPVPAAPPRNSIRENRIKFLTAKAKLNEQEGKELERLKARAGDKSAVQAEATAPVGVEGYDAWYDSEVEAKDAMQSMRDNGIPADRVSTAYDNRSDSFKYKVYRSQEEVDRINAESKQKRAAAETVVKEKEAADLAKRTDLKGYGAGFTAMRRGAVTATLNKLVTHNGVEMTLKDKVAELVAAGAKLSTMEVDAVAPMTRTQFNRASQKEQDAHAKRVREGGKKTVYLINDHDMSKTAYDYAQYLMEKGEVVKNSVLPGSPGATMPSMKPPRAAWSGFPDVLIHAGESDVKKHPLYQAAKSGDADSAGQLVDETVSTGQVTALRSILAGRKPLLVSVHAYEETGVNAIPEAFSDKLSGLLSLPVDGNIVQTNVVGHTGADGFSRMARQALFSGEVTKGAEYVLVDDFVGQGGTLANLRGYIESHGGKVVAAVSLTGKPYSAKLALDTKSLQDLRDKHGDLEQWWQERFGHSFDSLTQSEARYLTRTENADTVRDRITAAEQAGNLSQAETDSVSNAPRLNVGDDSSFLPTEQQSSPITKTSKTTSTPPNHAWYIDREGHPIITTEKTATTGGFKGPYSTDEVSKLTGVHKDYLGETETEKPVYAPGEAEYKNGASPVSAADFMADITQKLNGDERFQEAVRGELKRAKARHLIEQYIQDEAEKVATKAMVQDVAGLGHAYNQLLTKNLTGVPVRLAQFAKEYLDNIIAGYMGNVLRDTKSIQPDLPPKSIDLFSTALESRDVGSLQQMVHPDNPAWRKMFEEATGIKLPKGVAASEKAVMAWSSRAKADSIDKPAKPAMVEGTNGGKEGKDDTGDGVEHAVRGSQANQDDRAGDEGSSTADVPGTQGKREAPAGTGGPTARDGGEFLGRGAGNSPERKTSSTKPGVGSGNDDEDQRGVARRYRGLDGVSRGVDYRIPRGGLTRTGSWPKTAERNLDIIALVKQLDEEGRPATVAEQELLVKYTGFGASEIANGLFPGYAQQGKVYPSWAKAEWKATVQRLEDLQLSDEELRTLVKSTQYAHYTSEPIVRSIWSAVQRLGFTGGSILEPGMGSGNFLGAMPDELHAVSRYTGVEMDHLTAKIAGYLYPEQHILQADYTKQKLPENFFDVAIGNPPFAKIEVLSDPQYRKQKFSLHDYFFAKTLDRVHPGGLMVFITSRYTMDKVNDKARAWLNDRADLLGAIRLSQAAFKQHSGTDVVTDVLFFRKKIAGEATKGEAWGELAEVSTPEGPFKINEYYAHYPEMVLGAHSGKGKMQNRTEPQYTVLPREGDIDEQFAAAVAQLPKNVYSIVASSPERQKAAVAERDFNPKLKKEGGIYLNDDGVLMSVEQGAGQQLDTMQRVSAKDKVWLTDYVALRDAVKQAKADQWHEGPWEKSLKAAEKLYRAFVKTHGKINEFTVHEKLEEDEDGNRITTEIRRFKNSRLIKIDTEGNIVGSLEKIDDNGKIVDGDFFKGRTVRKPDVPDIKSVSDALAVSLDTTGELDLSHVAELAGLSRAEAIESLGDLVYQVPGGDHVLADEYLSGDVVTKLAEAEQAAYADERFLRNVKALSEVQPKPLTNRDISVKLGATWLQPEVMGAFSEEVLGNVVNVDYNPVRGIWTVVNSATEQQSRYSSRRGSAARKPQELRGSGEWSTPERGSNEILEAVLNNRVIKITTTIGSGKDKQTVVDTSATTLANEKATAMRDRFKTWIWEDADRAGKLLDEYNGKYNNLAPRRFNGSHLTLPGVSLKYKLHPHQLRAIWRVIQTGSTYLAHAVGSGKAQPLDAKILTPTGWSTMKDIAVGCEVIAGDGTATRVTGVYPQGEKEIYRIEFSDGSATECCDEHLWLTQTYLERSAGQRAITMGKEWPSGAAKVRTLAEIRGSLVSSHLGAKNHTIPMVEAVAFESRRVSLDPYLMGVLLGDGSKSADKFVPEDYKLNTPEVRLSLLQGLLDTDGGTSKSGHSVYYYSVSNKLADDVEFLVQSLGGIVRRSLKTPFYHHNGERRQGQPCHILCISLPSHIIPFRLKRRVDLYRPKSKYIPARYIVSVTPAGRKQAQCIMVEHADHLYVTDDFIVTHNTIEMIASGMEMKRLGQIAKPLYVVPNHMLEQFSGEFQELYPMANIMVADEHNFHTTNRRRFMAQASMNNPDAVIITHSSFKLLKMKPENVAAVRDEILDEMREYLSELQDEDGSDRKSFNTKQMENRIEQLEQRFDSIAGNEKADQGLTLEELGCDFLFVDEAHNFRKLDFVTNRKIKGVDPVGSKGALQLYIATRWLSSKKPGRSHVFASGTPITNTMGELYTIQKFFQHDQMLADGLNHFDGWAAMFTEVTTEYEPNAAGRYEPVDYLGKFDNLPELGKRIRTFMDVLTSQALGDYVVRPEIAGGQPEIIVSPLVPELKEYMESVLNPRIERSKLWKPTREEPNNPDPIIAIIADARLANSDIRYTDPAAPNNPDSKLNRMIDEIVRDYKASSTLQYLDKDTGKIEAKKGAALIVFYNQGFGTAVTKNRGFDARGWMMKRFKAEGIPAAEVAWIDDYATAAEKETMMKEVRQGVKRIIIGSAKKMGTGMNVQKRLMYLHYMDPPWYPADITQPDGRIIRQGNQNKVAYLKRYATKGTYDANMWGKVTRKARFIEQFLNGDDSVRSMEDLSESSQFAMVSAMAAGDERVITLVKLNSEVEKLNKLESAHVREQSDLRYEISSLESGIKSIGARSADLKEAASKVGGYIREVKGEVGGRTYDKREELGQALLNRYHATVDALLNDVPDKNGERVLGKVNGFTVAIRWMVWERPGDGKKSAPQLELTHASIGIKITPRVEDSVVSADIRDNWMLPAQSSRGIADKLINQLNQVDRDLATSQKRLEEKKQELTIKRKRLGMPFSYARELAEKIAAVTQLEEELRADKTAVPVVAGSADGFELTGQEYGRIDPKAWLTALLVKHGEPGKVTPVELDDGRPGYEIITPEDDDRSEQLIEAARDRGFVFEDEESGYDVLRFSYDEQAPQREVDQTNLHYDLNVVRQEAVSRAIDRDKDENGTGQTKTENFRKWFGDWDTLAKTPEVTELKLVGWDGSIKDLQQLARKVYAENLQGKEIENTDTGNRIRFAAEGKGEAFAGIKDNIDAEVVNALSELVRRAVRIDTKKPSPARMEDTRLFHYLVAPLAIDGHVYTVKLTIREALKGPNDVSKFKFYDVAVIRKSPLGHGFNDSQRTIASVSSGLFLKYRIADLVTAFKGENLQHIPDVSKVVDDDGKPLVVYHGTGERFWKFKPGEEGGSFFTTNENAASDYGDRVEPVYLNIRKPYDVTEKQWFSGEGLSPEEARDKGYDGYVIRDHAIGGEEDTVHDDRGDTWITFSPEQIKSVDKNNGAFAADNPDIRYDLSQVQQDAVSRAIDRAIARQKGDDVPEMQRTSALLRLRTLDKQLESGKISDAAYIYQTRMLYGSLENKAAEAKYGKDTERARGADFIRQRLLEAKRHGDLSEAEVSFAEWFIQKNPRLLTELGISIKQAPAGSDAAGSYNQLGKIINIFRGHNSNTTTVHEILHHMERMMPADLQAEVRKAWLTALLKGATSKDPNMMQFTHHILEAGMLGKVQGQRELGKAREMLVNNDLPYDNYALLNPSEFWAVNATRVVGERYAANDNVWGKTLHWLKEAVQHVKKVLGLKNDAVIITALNRVAKGDGVELSQEMLSEGKRDFSAVGLEDNATLNLNAAPDGNDVNPTFRDIDVRQGQESETAQRANSAIRLLPDGTFVDSLKQFVNPLDWSRLERLLSEAAPPAVSRGIAFLFRNPVFEAEKDPRKKPFVEAGTQREEDRMSVRLRFMDYHGPGERKSVVAQLKNYLGTWRAEGDPRTSWGLLQQAWSRMDKAQRAAFDTMIVEGDYNGRAYTTLPRANQNPRIRAAGVTPEIFSLYRGLRDHMDGHVARVIEQLFAESYLQSAMQRGDVAENVAALDPQHKAQLDEALREWSQLGIVHKGKERPEQMSPATWDAYRQIRNLVEPRLVKSIGDARRRNVEITGWMHRYHGDGEHAVSVYHTIDHLTFDLSQHGETFKAFLPYYPGARLSRQLEGIAASVWPDNTDSHFIQPHSNGRVIVQGEESEVRQFVDRAQGLEIDDPETGDPDRVLVYKRYVATERQAKKLHEQVAGNLKKAMPLNYRPGMQYQVKHGEVNALTEAMYGDINDRALEEAQRQAFKKMLAKGDIGRDEYDAMLDELIWNTAEVVLGRAAGRYQIRRANYVIEGYDREDTFHLFGDYQTAKAGQFSKMLYAVRQGRNFRDADGGTKKWAEPYIARTLRNYGAADRMSGVARSIATFMYLGFKPATCVAFATNAYTFGAAELSRHTDRAASRILQAQASIISGKLTRDERELFDSSFWHVQEQETAVSEAAGLHEGMAGKGGAFWQTLVEKSMAPLRQVELFSRKSVVLAAYRAFRNAALPDGQLDAGAVAKAKDLNQLANHEISRGNLPGFAAHNPLGRTVYSLQTFIFRSFNWIYNRSTSGEKRDMKAMMRLLGTMFLIGGAMALPGTDEINRLYRNLFGTDLKLELKTWMHKNLRQYDSLGEALYAFAMHGIGGVMGVNISNSHRVQMPFFAPLLDGKSLTEDVSGVYAGMIGKGVKAGKSFARGDIYRGVEALAPEGIAPGMKAFRQYTQGVTTAGGRPIFGPDGKPVTYDLGEALISAGGFHPLAKSELAEQEQVRREVVKHWGDKRSELLDSFRVAAQRGERSGAMNKIAQFNRDVRESQAWPEVKIIKGDTLQRARSDRPNKGKLGWYHQQTE